jgi:hypothetical protein
MANDSLGGGGYSNNTAANTFNQYAGLYSSAYAPQTQAINNQNALLNSQIGGLGAAYGASSGAMSRAAGIDQQKLGVQQAAIGQERGSLGRQRGYLGNRYGVVAGQADMNLGYNDQYQGFNDQYQGFQDNYMTLLQQKLQEQKMGFFIDEVKNQQDYKNEVRNLTSDAIARGANVSQGVTDDAIQLQRTRDYNTLTGRNNQDLAFNAGLKEAVGINDSKAHLSEQRAQLQQQRENIVYDKELARLDTNEALSKLYDRDAQLGYQAQALGLEKQAVGARLQAGLANLNLNQYLSVGQLMDQMASNDVQRQGIAANVFMQAMNASQGN